LLQNFLTAYDSIVKTLKVTFLPVPGSGQEQIPLRH
jgi:hypothetical protein